MIEHRMLKHHRVLLSILPSFKALKNTTANKPIFKLGGLFTISPCSQRHIFQTRIRINVACLL